VVWLAGWSYRKSHIVHPQNGAGSNYVIRIVVRYGSGTSFGEDVYCGGHCKSDFGDVRFTKIDGSTLLSYWLEKKVNSDYAIFWVKIPDSLDFVDVTLYIYYGKADATYDGNGNYVFTFFDDFEDGVLDTNKWDYDAGGGTIVEADGQLKLDRSQTGTQTGVYVRTKTALSALYRMECLFNLVNLNHCERQRVIPVKLNNVNNNPFDMGFFGYSATIWAVFFNGWVGTFKGTYNTWYRHIQSTPLVNAVWIVINPDGSIGDSNVYTPITQTAKFSFVAGDAGGSLLGTLYLDFVFIRPYVSPEPYQGTWSSEGSPHSMSGVMRDYSGVPLGNCVVQLYRTNDKVFIEEAISDGDGNYLFTVDDGVTQFFVKAYKDGTPNVFGVTDRDLTGV